MSILRVSGFALGLVLVIAACGDVSVDQGSLVESATEPVTTTSPVTSTTATTTTAAPATTAVETTAPSTEPSPSSTRVLEGEPPFLVEILELRDSAGPGKIAGFMNLRGPSHSGTPTSPEQPVCVGVGDFSDAQPGTPISVTSDTGDVVGVELRGSAYDAHLGCGLWFGVEVPAATVGYTISIGTFAPVDVTIGELDDHGWIVEFWSDEVSLEVYCVEMIEDYEPGVCRLLVPG